jgi:hypothetical protein
MTLADPTVVVEIDRSERDVLYREARLSMDGIGDVSMCLDRQGPAHPGHGLEARELFFGRYTHAAVVLEEIGWEEDDARDRFALPLTDEVRTWLIDRRRSALETIGADECPGLLDEDLAVVRVCSTLLAAATDQASA